MPGINPILYEFLNLVLAALALFMAGVFGRYLLIEQMRYTDEGQRWRLLRSPNSAQRAAAGLFALSVGAAGLRGYTWVARFGDHIGHDMNWLGVFPWTVIPVAAAAIEITGLLCCARVLVPRTWAYEITTAIVLVALFVTLLR